MSGKLSHLTWGGLISELVVTTNNEKSADVIVVPVRYEGLNLKKYRALTKSIPC